MPDSSATKPPRLSPTTRWSLIVAAGNEEGNVAEARQALEQLCQMYWQPVFRYICSRGYSEADAQDLAQDFFVRFSHAAFLQKARARFGRFRALVFSALRHLLCDHADQAAALKRGGGREIFSLEDWMASEDERAPAAGPADGAGQMFDYDWAGLVVQKALARLEDDFVARGKTRHFAVLRPFLTAGEKSAACAEAAAALGVGVTTLKPMIHHFRARYGSFLRDEVAQTVADPRDMDDEIRHLRTILGSRAVALTRIS